MSEKNTTGRKINRTTLSLEDAVERFLRDFGEMVNKDREAYESGGTRIPAKDADGILRRLRAAFLDHKGVDNFVPRKSYEQKVQRGIGRDHVEITETHESYGLVQINRVSGGMKLWGSSVHHQHFFRLVVKRAKRTVDDYTEHYWEDGRVPVVEIAMSAAQFVDLMAGMNQGSGTPCTIVEVDGVAMDPVPEDAGTVISVIVDEFARKLDETTAKLRGLEGQLAELLNKKAPTKDDKAQIQSAVWSARRLIDDSAPWLIKMIGEHSEHIVARGKQEIDSFIQLALRNAGIKSIADAGGRLMLSDSSTKKIDDGGGSR